MSAFICDKAHIVYLVTAAMSRSLNHYGSFSWYFPDATQPCGKQRGELACNDYEKAAEIANMLWRENIKSVSYRYPGESSDTLPGPVGGNFVITERDICVFHPPIDPVQVLKSCDCYGYQTCEHPEWESSEAYAFIDSLRHHAWSSLPGYDAANWGGPREKGARVAA